jgi:hypothetical protein
MEKRLILTTEGGKKTSEDISKPGSDNRWTKKARGAAARSKFAAYAPLYPYVNRVYRWL